MLFNTFDLIDATHRADRCVSYNRFNNQWISTLYTLATVIEVKENDGFEFLSICSVRYESDHQMDKATFFFSARVNNEVKYFRCILASSCSRWEFISWNEVDINESHRMIPGLTLFVRK